MFNRQRRSFANIPMSDKKLIEIDIKACSGLCVRQDRFPVATDC